MPESTETVTHKHKSKHKAIINATVNFPYEWCALIITAILFLLYFSKKFIITSDNNTEWLALMYFGFSILLASLLFSSHRYKKLAIYNDRIKVRRIFNPFTQSYPIINLMRFELLETYSGRRLHYYIRIFDIDNRKVILLKDNFPNYDKILRSLMHSKLTYTGKIKVSWEYRRAFISTSKWVIVLIPAIYSLLLLIRSMADS